MSRFALLLPLVATACGASAASLREARTARYDAPFATVWNVVTEEVHQRFPSVPVEDPINGTVATDYLRVANSEDPSMASTPVGGSTTGGITGSTTQLAPGQTSYGQVSFIAFRVIVQVKGPPWHVMVDGEAAEYKPGMAQIVPIKHGQADEPPWVENRIRSLTLDIHNRLKKYMLKTPPAEAVASKTFDNDQSALWKNLPDPQAAAVIGLVHRAALARDTTALRPLMADDFRWGLGAEGSADTAVALWAADPTKLRELARSLEQGCVAEEATAEVVCPARPAAGAAMARFKRQGGAWKFVLFLVR